MGYPPCANPKHCDNSSCCTQGGKYEWPELLGKEGTIAKTLIESENPGLTVVTKAADSTIAVTDFCCNRVLMYVSPGGSVVLPHPRVG
ncbi:inhibitor of trypsin and hageman factor-like [Chenopodium quinoa]|uniref:Uncharacterized protein n=1 Tax=Chenopodium quinoa TaxID=63459 RepID=A0A803L4X3_CHEQI|nr:inhibitor of trypsin and hageman factor-like [Chenopodium quinoa]